MTHEERRKLIETPIAINVVRPSVTWAGAAYMDDDNKTRLHYNDHYWRNIGTIDPEEA